MNSPQATHPSTNGMLNGTIIRTFVSELVRDFDERHSNGIDVEIANRLRNLDRVSVKVKGMDYRSRFSNNGISQVRIRMRLKQVTGLVSG